MVGRTGHGVDTTRCLPYVLERYVSQGLGIQRTGQRHGECSALHRPACDVQLHTTTITSGLTGWGLHVHVYIVGRQGDNASRHQDRCRSERERGRLPRKANGERTNQSPKCCGSSSPGQDIDAVFSLLGSALYSQRRVCRRHVRQGPLHCVQLTDTVGDRSAVCCSYTGPLLTNCRIQNDLGPSREPPDEDGPG